MKNRIALLCVGLLSLNMLLAGLAFLIDPPLTLAAESLGLVTPGRLIGSEEDSPFGLNIHAATRYATPGQLQIPLDSAQATGAAWDREEIRWDRVQKSDNTFDFSLVDEAVNKARARGINVLGLLLYNRDLSKNLPDLTAWSNYVSNTIRHFSGRVNYWQVWNEPENNIYLAGANPTDYAKLLKASFSTIKAANPAAKVVTAGVNGFAVPWLEKMLAAGGAGQYDILAVHPYVLFPTSPEAKYWVDNQLAYIMAFNRRHGNKPVWATEFGWTTGGNDGTAVSENAQANYLARAYVSGLSAGLSKIFMYQFHDEGTKDSYGLVRENWLTQKPSYAAYKNLVTRLSGATYRDKINLSDNTLQLIDDFENSRAWSPYNVGPNTSTTTISSEQVHSGNKALKVDYGLNGGAYIELGPPTPLQLPGQPTKVGFWVYGDDTGALFRILIKGNDGQLFVYEPGKAGGKYWHQLEAFLPGENVLHSGDGVLRYPVTFQSIQLTRQPDPNELTWNSTLYLDDFYAEAGANVQLYRFAKKGRTLDVVWTDGGGTNVSIPTRSSQGEVKAYNRDGATSVGFNVNNNSLNFSVGDEMLFFEHVAAEPTPPPAVTPPPLVPSGSCGAVSPEVSPARSFSDPAFQSLWARYDQPAPGNRSYIWGGQPLAVGTEPYAQSPNGTRKILYFDKSRMEITNPSGNSTAFGYVTNGLLTVELMTGKIQTGNNQDDPNQFIRCLPSTLPVAGDNDDTSGPKYASLSQRRSDPPKEVGTAVNEAIDASGKLSSVTNSYGVVGGYFEPATNHTIAKPFWDFLNDPNQKLVENGQPKVGKLFDPYYAAPGLPITEAYWAQVKVGGEVKDVLIQAFERRVLTYTPSNEPAFRVEWGNIGRHYYNWRYGLNP
jgi:hypothetical protein